MATHKICTLCKQDKPLSDFHTNPNASDGKHTRCAECINRIALKRRQGTEKGKERARKAQLLSSGMKQCHACSAIKSLDEYYDKKAASDGKKSICKDCFNKRKRERSIGQEKIQQIEERKMLIDSGYKKCTGCGEVKPLSEFSKSKEKIPSKCKACVCIDTRQWYEKNKDRRNEVSIKWSTNNKERIAELSARWYRQNTDRAKARAQNRRGRIQEVGGSFTGKEFRELCNRYKNRCLCCGKEGKMTADHVIPLCRGGSNSIENIQPLCLECNLKKARKSIDYR